MKPEKNELKILDLVISTLIIYVLFSFTVQTFFEINTEIKSLLHYYDVGACVCFLTDWFIRFFRSDHKTRFAFRNSVDFIVSLPIAEIFAHVGFLKILQLSRLIRVAKIITSIHRIKTIATLDKVKLCKVIGAMVFLLTLLISPILMLMAEGDEGNIRTAGDAIWWTYCTISTIGYGDMYPVTTMGRTIAFVSSLGGIIIFSIVTGLFVNFIIRKRKQK